MEYKRKAGEGRWKTGTVWGAAGITAHVGSLLRARVHAGSSAGDAQLCPAVPSATPQLHLLGLRRSRREESSFGRLWYRRGWIEENTSCLLRWWSTLSWITQLSRRRTEIHLAKTWSFPGTDIKKVGKGMKIPIIDEDNRNWDGGVRVCAHCSARQPCPPSRALYHLTAFSYLLFSPFPLISQLSNSFPGIHIKRCTRCCP